MLPTGSILSIAPAGTMKWWPKRRPDRIASASGSSGALP